jgi:putative membrane protein insertion efficiency factor
VAACGIQGRLAVKYVLIILLKAYRLLISPLYGNVCRYYPSCSAYALRAVQVHGAVKGSWLAGRRLLRCHPWSPGGYDPVPGTPEFEAEMRETAVRSATMEQPTGTGGVAAPEPSLASPSDPAGRLRNDNDAVASRRGVN